MKILISIGNFLMKKEIAPKSLIFLSLLYFFVKLLENMAADAVKPTNIALYPLNDPKIVQNMIEFKDMVVSSLDADPELFVKPAKIHLTISSLVLENAEELETAAKLIDKSLKEILKTLRHKGPIKANIKGLAIMNDDPSRVDVLYAKPNETEKPFFLLQMIANHVAKKLAEEGLGLKIRGDQVKLHCTIMNSAKKKKYDPTDEVGKDYSFDATRILERFSDYDFGQLEIMEIKLTEKGKAGPGEFYKSYRSFPL